jgi:hypothetical protein
MANKRIPLKKEGLIIEKCIIVWRWLLLHGVPAV